MKLPFFQGKSHKNALLPTTPGTKSVGRKGIFGDISPYAVYRGLDGSVYLFANLQPHQLVANFEEVSPLYTGVMRLANAVASLPIQLVDVETREKQPNHPAYQLLSRPNTEEQRIGSDLIRDMVVWKVLTGNIFFLMTGGHTRPPLELYLLNPLHTDFTASGAGRIGRINYYPDINTPIHFDKYEPTGTYRAALQELYLIQNFNVRRSTSDLGGKSETASLFYEINHYIHASQHNLSLLANGGRPSGAFVLKAKDGSPATLSEEAYERLKQQIYSEYAGAANAGKQLILEGGLEWQDMQLSPRDLDFAALRMQAEEHIYQALGVPIQLIMSVKTTANNMTNVRLEFYENRVLPLGDDLCAHLNVALLPRYGKDDVKKYAFIVDRDEIDVLIPQRAKKRDSLEKSLIMTINEKRKEYKLPEIEGGNKIVDPNGRYIAGPDLPPDMAQTSGAVTSLIQDNPDDENEEDAPEEEISDE